MIEPIFFALLGTLIGEFVNGPFSPGPRFCRSRSPCCSCAAWAAPLGSRSRKTSGKSPRTGRDLFAISWHPQGTLAVALAAQAVYLLEFQHNAFMTGLVMAAFLSQLVLVPPHKFTAIPRIRRFPCVCCASHSVFGIAIWLLPSPPLMALVGFLMTAAMVGARLGNRAKLPSVMGVIAAGLALGYAPIITPENHQNLQPFADVALAWVGLYLGTPISRPLFANPRLLAGGLCLYLAPVLTAFLALHLL